MSSFAVAPVSESPFPHVVTDGFLEPDLYEALADSFPACPPGSGPTGYSYFWGDPEYERLMAGSSAWRALFDRFQSQAFVDYALAQFGSTFRDECVHDISNARFVRYIETRDDKERPAIREVIHAPDELWVRVDIMQGRLGYNRGPHVDHRRRAATMLIYFNDADEIGMVGGDLLLHGEAAPISVRPRRNRAAMFACNNASLHSVSPIVKQDQPRNFVQVSLSSSVDLWEPMAPAVRPGLLAAAGRLVRRLR